MESSQAAEQQQTGQQTRQTAAETRMARLSRQIWTDWLLCLVTFLLLFSNFYTFCTFPVSYMAGIHTQLPGTQQSTTNSVRGGSNTGAICGGRHALCKGGVGNHCKHEQVVGSEWGASDNTWAAGQLLGSQSFNMQ